MYRTIKSACPTTHICNALHSFAIALLPFFNPTSNEVTDFEQAAMSTANVSSYLNHFRLSSVFWALAYYALSVGFRVQPEIEEGLKEIAQMFIDVKGYDDDTLEESLRPVYQANCKGKPSKINAPKKDLTTFRKRLAGDIVNLIYVEFGRKFNKDFKVILN